MNKQNNQEINDSGLFSGIQGEVSAENAHLLQFITRHAATIAGVVILLLLAVIGMGVWNWHQGNVLADTQRELERISTRLQGAEKDEALLSLARNAPESMRLFIYLTLGKSAQENGNPKLAGEAYAMAARADEGGGIGLAAALGSASTLLAQGDYKGGLTLLQQLQSRDPQVAASRPFQQMLGEAADRAGNLQLAYQTYEALARDAQDAEAAYFRGRAEEVGARMDKTSPK